MQMWNICYELGLVKDMHLLGSFWKQRHQKRFRKKLSPKGALYSGVRQVFEWWQGVELSKKGCDRCGAVSNWWWWCFALKLLTLNNIIIKIPSFQTKRCFKTLSRCQMWFCTFISCLEKCKERFNRGNCIWKNKNWVLSTFKWLLWDSLFFLVITALHVLQQLIFCQRTQFKRQV